MGFETQWEYDGSKNGREVLTQESKQFLVKIDVHPFIL